VSAPHIGALRRRFAIEAPQTGASGAPAWRATGAAWGAIATNGDAVLITLRARADIAVGWRFRLGARVFLIDAVLRDETASGFLACRCRELSP
jgi:hypothetical protein